ncbi:MAG: hypothetical protein ACRDZ8_06255 [Acidimicrobiales bacterium]
MNLVLFYIIGLLLWVMSGLLVARPGRRVEWVDGKRVWVDGTGLLQAGVAARP